jgi:transcription termination factor Rho
MPIKRMTTKEKKDDAPVKEIKEVKNVKDSKEVKETKEATIASDMPSPKASTFPAAPVDTTQSISSNGNMTATASAAVSTSTSQAPVSTGNYSSGSNGSNSYGSRPYQGQRNDRQSHQSGRYNSYQNQNQNQYEDPQYYNGEVVSISGLLEVLPDYGVIRQKVKVDENLPRDVYISHSQIKRFNLRMGDAVKGFARPPKEGERYLSLLKIETIDGVDPESARKRPLFTELTPIFPNDWLKLETKGEIISTRLIDLVAPIGKGQRAMVVAPPKAGKTWLLKDIANGITTNHPEVVLMVALIGERPEEVTHFSRSVKGEVYASNFDEKAEEQTRVAEVCLERAKRLAEKGKDVVILMDSLTRLARAYNMVAPPSGRTLTGGFDPAALYPAKHFFGAARNFEEGGSLTIIATALVETGSRMDDVIFEEFKGTGNMELRLDRQLAERRIYPAIDIKASGTRHEEYLFSKDTLDQIFRLRRMVDLLEDRDSTDLVIDRLKKSKSNEEFLGNLHKGV